MKFSKYLTDDVFRGYGQSGGAGKSNAMKTDQEKQTDQKEFIQAAAGKQAPELDAVVGKYLDLALAGRPKEQEQGDVDDINHKSRIIQGNFDIQWIHDIQY
jgi:hypothetical protein